MTLANQFAAYSEWRVRLAGCIELFRAWLVDNELNDAQANLRLTHLLERLREDRLYVAFVAEFSRGKSELINAIFFADYGNRMLPSSAGRTTMCPTELLYDASRPPYIELLPIQTRSTNASVSEYKRFREEWISYSLDLNSVDSMQQALRQVSQVIRVSPEEAIALGFHFGNTEANIKANAEHLEDDLQIGADGLIEIPRWRHAVINFPHPLLKQGLVILDTPGLNAIGTEPELTLSLLPNAHAILFILAADTGVTQSDLTLWRDHISSGGPARKGRMVVMNKIDGLWDELKQETEIEAEIRKQAAVCGQILDLPPEQIFPVSAQKGLVAKVTDDMQLLHRSRLPALEHALSQKLIPAKQDIVRENSEAEFNDIYQRVRNLLESRIVALGEQLNELNELRGKNKGVVEYMMGKVKAEKEEFEAGLLRYYAVRSVFSTMTNNLFSHLGLDALKSLTLSTRDAMRSANFSKSLSEAIDTFFGQIRENLARSNAEIREILNMMEVIYKKFTVEHGLVLNSPPTPFSLLRYEKEIDRLEAWCNTHLVTMVSLLTQEKRHIIQKFFDEITTQVRLAFEHANRDAEVWLKAIMSPMETQVREHQMHLKRRLESIKRIHQATDTLEGRINELDTMRNNYQTQQAVLVQIACDMEDLLGHGDDEPLPVLDPIASPTVNVVPDADVVNTQNVNDATEHNPA